MRASGAAAREARTPFLGGVNFLVVSNQLRRPFRIEPPWRRAHRQGTCGIRGRFGKKMRIWHVLAEDEQVRDVVWPIRTRSTLQTASIEPSSCAGFARVEASDRLFPGAFRSRPLVGGNTRGVAGGPKFYVGRGQSPHDEGWPRGAGGVHRFKATRRGMGHARAGFDQRGSARIASSIVVDAYRGSRIKLRRSDGRTDGPGKQAGGAQRTLRCRRPL